MKYSKEMEDLLIEISLMPHDEFEEFLRKEKRDFWKKILQVYIVFITLALIIFFAPSPYS